MPFQSPTLPSLPAPERLPEQHRQFVDWLRQVAPYIHKFRGQTFVVGIPGEMAATSGALNALIQDLSLLHSIGIHIVIVNGCRPQINEQLRLRGQVPQYHNGLRITDAVALECAKEAAGAIRYDMEAGFSQGLPNTPMATAGIRVVSGNFTLARPVGIVDGVDHVYSGVVRKVDAVSIQRALDNQQIVLLSNIGHSATGEAFNLAMEEVAAATAMALDADKLVFLAEVPGVHGDDGRIQTEISEARARALLARDDLTLPLRIYLSAALKACEGGVARSHIVPFAVDGSVLLEFFLHDGVGTMVVEDAFPEERMAEMACLAVNPTVQSQGDGERLLQRIEQRAREAGITQLFVLTTRTAHWFLKRGFVMGSVDDLPGSRRNLYNWQRRSQVLLKTL